MRTTSCNAWIIITIVVMAAASVYTGTVSNTERKEAINTNANLTLPCEDFIPILEKKIAYGERYYGSPSLHMEKLNHRIAYTNEYGGECTYTIDRMDKHAGKSFLFGAFTFIGVMGTVVLIGRLGNNNLTNHCCYAHRNWKPNNRKEVKVKEVKEKSKMKLPYSFFPWVITLASVVLTYTNALGFTSVEWQYIVLPPLFVFGGIVILGITAAITGFQVAKWLFGKLMNIPDAFRKEALRNE